MLNAQTKLDEAEAAEYPDSEAINAIKETIEQLKYQLKEVEDEATRRKGERESNRILSYQCNLG